MSENYQSTSPETFGAYLRNQREKRGIRLEEIASITKINLKTLQTMEEGNWDALPPEPFIRGFITAYSKYVGIETKEALATYSEWAKRNGAAAPQVSEEAESHFETPDPTPAPPLDKSSETESPNHLIEHNPVLPTKKIFAGAALAIVIAVGAGVMYIGKKSTQKVAANPPATDAVTSPSEASPTVAAIETATTPAPTPTTPVATAPETKTQPRGVASPTPESSSAPETFTHQVVVQGKERTWMKVVIDEGTPTESFLDSGQTVTFNAKSKIKVVLGNSTGSTVVHNGETSAGKKLQGTIRTYLFPPEARFPQDIPAKKVESTEEDSTPPTDSHSDT
jgi:cytoskeletal protein RodZ